VLVKYKADLIIISLKINLFSPWFSWINAELALNNNNSQKAPPSKNGKHVLGLRNALSEIFPYNLMIFIHNIYKCCFHWLFRLCKSNLKLKLSRVFLLAFWELLLFNANSAFIQLNHGENKLIFNEIIMRSALYLTNTLSWSFIVQVHWNNSRRIDMSLHSDTLLVSWFRAKDSFSFMLRA
jgi:hypothetical protein